MRLYIENISEEEDKFVATIKGNSNELLSLMNFYYNSIKKRDNKSEAELLEKQIRQQVENARKRFEEKNEQNTNN